MKVIQDQVNVLGESTRKWVQDKYAQIALFNIVIVILVLLRSAGYFEPYIPLTINLIVFISILMAVFLLGARNREVFALSLFFWIFAALLRVIGVDIWAERAGVYTYQSLVVATFLLLYESTYRKFKKKQEKK